MPYARLFILLLSGIAGAVGAGGAAAQVPADSLREYDLGEVVVGSASEETVAPATLQRVPLAAVDRLDAVSVAEVARLIPAAHVQTNSRGEALVYLRAAGERQVALFFDGALLNVPWDNRVDLGLVPSSVVGGITVAKGVPSVLWGANVLGGAVNMVSRGLDGEGVVGDITYQVGSEGFRRRATTLLARRGRWAFVASTDIAERDGFALPENAELPFSQASDGVRTNTDLDLTSLFGRVSYDASARSRIGFSILHVGGSKGVAPEGHLDPAVDRVRYWRYPDWRMTMGIVSGEAGLGPVTTLRGAAWASLFGQTISSYTSAAYDDRESSQVDEDRTAGGRLILQHAFAPVTLRLGLNALVSTHEQQESEAGSSPFENGPTLTFRQGLYSVGLEAETAPAERLTLTAGTSIDALTTPETGDKPTRDAFTDYGLTSGAVYRVAEGWALNASLGRKARFPTMRELFGEALNRFVVNPDLQPESSVLAEASVRRSGELLSGEVTVFLNHTGDTIDQERLEDGRRRRVNLGSSRVVGVELAAALRPVPRVRFDGHLAMMDIRGFDESGGSVRLSEKPEALGRLAATYNPGVGPNATVEAVYTGVAYSPAGPDTFARLDPALVFNVRVGVRSTVLWLGVTGEAFARLNNVTDAVVLPQLGLPGPGREVQAGVKLFL
jgi:iron complex outermembrane receptor protein